MIKSFAGSFFRVDWFIEWASRSDCFFSFSNNRSDVEIHLWRLYVIVSRR